MSDKPRETVKPVRFELMADPGSAVFVAGSFNGWNPRYAQMTDENGSGLYSLTMYLPPGSYEYKFVINGVWTADPGCPQWTANPLGSLNSLLTVE
jgi:1,4-alpha-glucan branching enzyme